LVVAAVVGAQAVAVAVVRAAALLELVGLAQAAVRPEPVGPAAVVVQARAQERVQALLLRVALLEQVVLAAVADRAAAVAVAGAAALLLPSFCIA